MTRLPASKAVQNHFLAELQVKLCFETKSTKLYLRMSLVRSSHKIFFLTVFYLIMWLMKVSKNFGKIAILKILKLISSWGVKIHFGKLALKWCICRHEIIIFSCLKMHHFRAILPKWVLISPKEISSPIFKMAIFPKFFEAFMTQVIR